MIFAEKEPSPDGCDTIRFLMSANVGSDLRPIARIASGGELARIMLALKNVLAEQEAVGTLVFDEVDTGVSGRAAQKVAEKLAQVSRRKQVLCVTHLPQLAAMADTHFSVEKGESKGRTFTHVILLDREARKGGAGPADRRHQVTPALLESAGGAAGRGRVIPKKSVTRREQHGRIVGGPGTCGRGAAVRYGISLLPVRMDFPVLTLMTNFLERC